MMKALILLFILVLAKVSFAGNPELVSHPRLLVTKADYTELRARFLQQPWSTSTFRFWNLNPSWERPISSRAENSMMGYILDTDPAPPTRSNYVQGVIGAINGLYENPFSNVDFSHSKYVNPTGAALICIIAFDVIYEAPELSTEDRQTAYQQLKEIVDWYRANPHHWPLSRLGLLAVWSMFEGDPAEIAVDVDNYRKQLLDSQVFPDGSWGQSPGYFGARMNGGRWAKFAAIDIASFTGAYDFYNDPQMQGMMDWMASFWLTPFGSEQIFGDSFLLNPGSGGRLPARMLQYGEKHGRVGKWILEKFNSEGFPSLDSYPDLGGYTYLTSESSFAHLEALMPSSLLKKDYGAALWGQDDSKETLMGTLHCLSRGAGHSHEDTNTLHLVGYGEHLFHNSPTSYFANYDGVSGSAYIQAWLQNTVLIGNETRHASRHGAGLVGGLTGGPVEFGRTDSGSAVRHGKHYRNLFLVHPESGKSNGYFILSDEVKPDTVTDEVKINLHPNSTTISTITSNQEYHMPINFNRQSTSDMTEAVSVFYATSPNQVNQPIGKRPQSGVGVVDHAYLEGVYSAGSDGWLRAVTVIFPEDGTHAKASMQQVSGTGFTGANIDHGGGVMDTVLCSNNDTNRSHGGISFRALNTFFRKESNAVKNYAVVNGLLFREGTNGPGFSSNHAISLQMDGSVGQIECYQEAVVSFYGLGLDSVEIDGIPAVSQSVSGGVQLTVPTGRHTITLLGNGTPFGGVARAIPGIIQAEDFNLGGQGIAYNDVDPTTDNGNSNYRPGEGVDIFNGNSQYPERIVGWIRNDEFLNYDINVTPGIYQVSVRTASAHSTPGGLEVRLNGLLMGTMDINNTGSWHVYTDVSLGSSLRLDKSGIQELGLKAIDGGQFNVDFIKFERIAPLPEIDSDGDMLTDSFEQTNYGHPTDATDGSGDIDSDGHSDRSEVIAGTDPHDKGSFLFLTSETMVDENGMTTLQWSSIPGENYIVWKSSTLAVGDWIPVVSFTATATTSEYGGLPRTESAMYYRVSTFAP